MMRKRQFRYLLPFLILVLFVFATVVNSQEHTNNPDEESKKTKQSQDEKTKEESEIAEQPQDEKISEETEVTEPTPENSIPSESQSNTLNNNFKRMQLAFEASKEAFDNLFQFFVLITISPIIIIIISAFVIFWVRHLHKKQHNKLTNSEESLMGELNQNQQRLEDQLKSISKQSIDNTANTASHISTIRNDLGKFHSIITRYENRFNNIDNTLEELKIDRETHIAPDNSEVDEMDVQSTVLETQKRTDKLVLDYKDGEPIDLDKIDTTTPSQNKVLDLNWIVRELSEWITELEQSDEGKGDLIHSLKYAMHAIKNKLKTIRGEFPLVLKPPKLETDLELDDVRNQSIAYPAQLEGMLIGYELNRRLDEEEYDRYIKQFIKDNLFNNVAKHIPHDQVQEQLGRFLQLADYEIIPVEVGITEADSLYHDIQGSIQTDVKRGTVAEVISLGLMHNTDNLIVQKPVIIRGE